MDILVLILFVLFSLLGLLSLVFNLPGNFIILTLCVLYGWYGGFMEITFTVIAVLAGLALLGELLEFLLGVAGAKKWRSSNAAVVGSIAGGIVGAILGVPFFFGIGALVGGLLGAFLGATVVEKARGLALREAMHSGIGAFVGKLGGMLTKAVIGCAMIVLTVVAAIGD